MKFYKIIIIEFIVFTFAVANSVWAQPKAEVKPIEYDFGDVLQDSIVTKVFVITNTGDQILKITDIKASCGCTAVVAGKKELNPGESTDIKASFNSEGKQGKQNKTITVNTNVPEKPTIKLSLTGNVLKKDLKNSKAEHSSTGKH